MLLNRFSSPLILPVASSHSQLTALLCTNCAALLKFFVGRRPVESSFHKHQYIPWGDNWWVGCSFFSRFPTLSFIWFANFWQTAAGAFITQHQISVYSAVCTVCHRGNTSNECCVCECEIVLYLDLFSLFYIQRSSLVPAAWPPANNSHFENYLKNCSILLSLAGTAHSQIPCGGLRPVNRPSTHALSLSLLSAISLITHNYDANPNVIYVDGHDYSWSSSHAIVLLRRSIAVAYNRSEKKNRWVGESWAREK